MSVLELNAVTGVGQYLGYETFEFQQFSFGTLCSFSMTGPIPRARSMVVLRPVFAIDEGNRTDTARRLNWLALATLLMRRAVAVPLLPLGSATRFGSGALIGRRVRPPWIGAPVADRDSLANKLLDIAQEGQFLAVAQRDRNTLRACARGATDTMYVGFRDIR